MWFEELPAIQKRKQNRVKIYLGQLAGQNGTQIKKINGTCCVSFTLKILHPWTG